jgi:hypothetical protein
MFVVKDSDAHRLYAVFWKPLRFLYYVTTVFVLPGVSTDIVASYGNIIDYNILTFFGASFALLYLFVWFCALGIMLLGTCFHRILIYFVDIRPTKGRTQDDAYALAQCGSRYELYKAWQKPTKDRSSWELSLIASDGFLNNLFFYRINIYRSKILKRFYEENPDINELDERYFFIERNLRISLFQKVITSPLFLTNVTRLGVTFWGVYVFARGYYESCCENIFTF